MPRYFDISIFRYFDISTSRYIEDSFYLPCSVAFRISATTPERFAGVSAFLGDALDHRLAAFGAYRRVFLYAFLFPMLQTLGSESFREATFNGKGSQVGFELFVEHRNEALAEVKKASCDSNGVIGVEPSVEFVLLSKDVHGTLVSDVVCVGYLIELYGFDFLVFGVMNGQGCLLVLKQPVEVVIGEFGEAGTSDVREFHFGLARGGMARSAFGDIGRA